MRVIETATLVLEPQVASHADEMFAVLSDPAIYEHENAPPLSVDPTQLRLVVLQLVALTTGVPGTLGAALSVHAGVVALPVALRVDSLPALSIADTA